MVVCLSGVTLPLSDKRPQKTNSGAHCPPQSYLQALAQPTQYVLFHEVGPHTHIVDLVVMGDFTQALLPHLRQKAHKH